MTSVFKSSFPPLLQRADATAAATRGSFPGQMTSHQTASEVISVMLPGVVRMAVVLDQTLEKMRVYL